MELGYFEDDVVLKMRRSVGWTHTVMRPFYALNVNNASEVRYDEVRRQRKPSEFQVYVFVGF
jgi:hypothetical protein